MTEHSQLWRESAAAPLFDPPDLLVALDPSLAGKKVDEATSKITIEDIVTASHRLEADEKVLRKIEVVATRMGYYGHKRRRQGDRFMLTLKDGEQLPDGLEPQPQFHPIIEESAHDQ